MRKPHRKKRCVACDKRKVLASFYGANTADGRMDTCIACTKEEANPLTASGMCRICCDIPERRPREGKCRGCGGRFSEETVTLEEIMQRPGGSNWGWV